MIKKDFYTTNTTTDGLQMTRNFYDLYGNDYPTTDCPIDLALPYYMGYITPDMYPESMKLLKAIPDDIENTTKITFEEDKRQNYSWFFAAQTYGSDSYFSVLYKRLPYDGGYRWSKLNLYGMNHAELQFINDMKIADYCFLGYMEIEFRGIIYNEESERFSGSTSTFWVQTTFETLKKMFDGDIGASLKFNHFDTNVELTINDYVEEEHVFKKSDGKGNILIFMIQNLWGHDRCEYDEQWIIRQKIMPVFKVETTDDEGADANIYTNAFPVGADLRITLDGDILAWDKEIPFGNAEDVSPYKGKMMLGNANPIDIKKIAELYDKNIGSSYIGVFYDNGRIYSRTGNNQLQFWSAIALRDVVFLAGFQNRIFDSTTDSSFPLPEEIYNEQTITPKYTDYDEPTGEFLNDDYDKIKNDLRPWQLIDASITENEYNDEDKPEPSEPEEGDDPEHEAVPGGKGEDKFSGDNVRGQKDRVLTRGSVTYYLLNTLDLINFNELLWAQPQSFYEQVNITSRLTGSIFDYIASIRYYPTDMETLVGSAGDSPIYLGTGATFMDTSGVNVPFKVVRTIVTQFNWKQWDLSDPDYHWRGNFLDYSPYTKMSIYLPYAGTFDLDLQTVAAYGDIRNASLYLDVGLDINMGAMTYYLNNGSANILSKTVKIGVDFPLTGNDSSEQAAAMLRNTFNIGQTIIGSVGNIGKMATQVGAKDVFGAIETGIETAASIGSAGIDTALANRQVPVQTGSFGGTLSNIGSGQEPYITVYRQKTANPKNYGHTVGYLADATYTIKNLAGKGYTVCKNPDLSGISALDGEKDLIAGLLTSGIYC